MLPYFDSEDAYRTGYWNVSHCQQYGPIQDFFHPDDQTQPTFEITWVQTFHSNIITKRYYHHYLFFFLNTIYFSILKQTKRMKVEPA